MFFIYMSDLSAGFMLTNAEASTQPYTYKCMNISLFCAFTDISLYIYEHVWTHTYFIPWCRHRRNAIRDLC